MKPKFKNITLRKIALFSLLFLFLPSFNKVLADSLPFSSGDSIEIEVITSEGSDRSHNDVGPELDYLKYNNIVRPGLCKLSCSSGQMNDQVTYYGVNLSSSQAYFGSNNNSFLGFYPNTASENFSILTTVPNLSQGETSVFAKNSVNSVSSNYLDFEKLAEDPQGPSISFFSPEIGSAGQYITIYGNGFYNSHGTSLVYFKNIENGATTSASFSFPDVCLQSVWSDNQVLIKVPEGLSDGDYKIGMKIRDWNEIESDKIFTASSSSPLLPSLCKISPALGPINSNVSLWGEYFGNNSLAVFSRNKLTSYIAPTSDSQADKISVSVPANSVTGPVGVQRENESSVGNSLNFTVGTCSSNSDCPNNSNYCCLPGTSLAGSCVVSSENCLASTTLNSVFQWDFTTGFATSTNNTDNNYSCASSNICLVDNVCPNSPGLCSPYAGGQTITSSACKNDCSSVEACNGASCFYQEKLNNNIFDRCIIGTENNPQTCSLSKIVNYNLSGIGSITKTATCKSVIINNEEKKYYTISVDNICPDNWTMISNGLCADTSAECNICSKGTNCQNLNNNTNSLGVCVSERLCSDSYTCQSDYCTKEDSASCQCCCDKNKNDSATGENPACCSPLTCDNTCGSGGDYGLCSGCKISDSASSSDRDSACNCTGTSGKYCQVDDKYTSGACLDCTSLSDETTCREHSASCCWDSNSNVCHGGTSDSSIWGNNSTNIGMCPYYGCDNSDNTICASSSPITISIGNYSSISKCQKDCPKNCSQYDNFTNCSLGDGCCWKTSVIPEEGAVYSNSGRCVGGEPYSNGDYQGLCTTFECTSSNTCTSTPFGSLEECSTEICQKKPFKPEISCKSTTTCDTSLCSSPFNCLGAFSDTDRCGFCCCDPNAEVDVCSNINSKLSCYANKGNCTGNNRGLCCGCSADKDCGDVNSTGCGSDSCCYSRLEIKSTLPADKYDKACRNTAIEIDFDQRIKINSLDGNILLLEESNTNNCTSDTYELSYLNETENNKSSWSQIKNRVIKSFDFVAKIFNNQVIAAPSSSKKYCGVLGRFDVEQKVDDTSVVYFYPNELLKPDTKYYIIVKGDEKLDSFTGVKSFRNIGMNGRGYKSETTGFYLESNADSGIKFNNIYYQNSNIFEFKTLDINSTGSGICAINYVKVDPYSYLFQSIDNDINENDTNSTDDSFNSAVDKDVVFFAKAYSEDGQVLATSTQYNWSWEWTVSNGQILEFNNNVIGWSGNNNKRMVQVKNGITTGESNIKAKIILSEGNIINTGDGLYNEANAVVLICKNPWPAIKKDGTWEAWNDQSSANYGPYNYKLFYCRDTGEEGEIDDLPAFSNNSIINRGSSLIKVCNNNPSQTCNNNSDCNGGLCLSNFLKETYFFREASTNNSTNVFNVNYYNSSGGNLSGSLAQIVEYGNDGTIITAIPNLGYNFVRWTDGSTANPRTDYNITGNISATAVFAIKTFKLDYLESKGGKIQGNLSQVVTYNGSGSTVTAIPTIADYYFVNWSDNSTANPRTDVNVTNNINVTANFAKVNIYTLKYKAGSGGTLKKEDEASSDYYSQEVVETQNGDSILAVPDTGYRFLKWNDGNTANPRTDVNVTNNINVTAEFAIQTFSLKYLSSGNGSISGNINQTINYGGSGTAVTASPNTGYRFKDWNDGKITVSRTDTNIVSNVGYTANFVPLTYTLTYSADSNGEISGSSTQIVNYNGNGLQVVAVPDSGYKFKVWSDGEANSLRRDLNVTNSKSFLATFDVDPSYTFTCGDTIMYGGQKYKTVKIGSQCWFAENLNIGTMINASNNQKNNSVVEKFCYNNDSSYCNTYGGLYQIDEAMFYNRTSEIQGICPTGWHIPSVQNYKTLISYLQSNSQYWCANSSSNYAKSLASKSGWSNSSISCAVGNNQSINNSSGFNALSNSSRIADSNTFNSFGQYANFWTSSYNNSYVSRLSISNLGKNAAFNDMSPSVGISIRCVQN